MLHLVIINGYGGAGKDTFVSMCCDFVIEHELFIPIQNYHHSDLAKKVLREMGWVGDKDFASRELLKKLTSYGDKTGKAMQEITKILTGIIEYTNEDDMVVLFYHARERTFIDDLTKWAKDRGISMTRLLIEREGKNEEPLCWYDIKPEDYDVVIKNNGALDDLMESAGWFMRKLLHAEKEIYGKN